MKQKPIDPNSSDHINSIEGPYLTGSCVEGAHAVNKPIGNETLMGRTSSTEVVQLANQILKLAAQGMATSVSSRPGDMNDVARLTLTYRLLERDFPGDWLLRPTEKYGVCLVSASWNDA